MRVTGWPRSTHRYQSQAPDQTPLRMRLRVLTVIDSFTRECLALKVAKSLPSSSVTETLNRVIMHRGAPRTIQVDNGSEFTSNHFDAWAYFRGIDVDFIRPGKPVTMCTSNRSTDPFETSA